MRRGFLCGAAAGVATAIRTKKGGVCTGGPAPPAAPPTHSGGVQGLGMAADGLPPRRPPGPPCGYRASRRSSRAVRRPSRRASRPARRPSRRASRPSRRAARRSCPAVWASASVTSAGLIALPMQPPVPAGKMLLDATSSSCCSLSNSRVTHVLHWTAVYSKKVRRPAMQKPVVGRVGLARGPGAAWPPAPRARPERADAPAHHLRPTLRPRAPRPGLDEALGGGLGSSQKGALRSCPLEVMNWPFNGANRRVSGPQRQRKTFLGFPPGDPTVGQQRDVISPFRTRPPPAHWGRRLD